MLSFEPECQAAITLAKQCLEDGRPLGVDLLLAALFHATSLKQWPELSVLAGILKEPVRCRDTAPDVPPSSELWDILKPLQGPRPISAPELLRALLKAPAGRRVLIDRGLKEEELVQVVQAIEGEPVSPTPGPPADGRPRLSPDLRRFVTVLTEEGSPATRRPGFAPEKPLRALMQNLLAPRMRSVLLVGPSGVGKTSLIYGLARRLLREKESVPEILRDLQIVQLQPGFPRSGPQALDDMNVAKDIERVRGLLRQLEANPNVALFVEDFAGFLHLLYRLSQHRELLDTFKDSLGTGKLTCLGCITPQELNNIPKMDDTLLRRFRVLHLRPPEADDVIDLLRRQAPLIKAHFQSVEIPESLLPKVVALADEHLRDRHQPEKSVRLLESACCRAVMDSPPAATLTEGHLLRALEDHVGPLILPGETLKAEEVARRLRERIVGQDHVIEPLAKAFVAARVDSSWYLQQGPRGVCLFAGPTGVGKTEMALELARILGGGREALVRVDCQNLGGSGTGWNAEQITWRLLGTAPGFVGYQPGCKDGLLVKVRDFPECVLLLDEFEKADNTVGKILLRVLDEGKAQDSEGNDLDFRRAFVILTTNAGVTYDKVRGEFGFRPLKRPRPEGEEGEPEAEKDRGKASASRQDVEADILATGLGREFLGRIQHYFEFRALAARDVRTIVEGRLNQLRLLFGGQRREFGWSPALLDRLTQYWDDQFGFRPIKHLLRTHVLEELNLAVAEGELDDRITEIYLDAVAAPGGPPPARIKVTRQVTGNRLVLMFQ